MALPLRTEFVTTADGSLLRTVRETIRSADELLICVALMSQSGVQLLEREFREVGERGVRTRLLVTTSFGMTDASALQAADRRLPGVTASADGTLHWSAPKRR